MLLEDAKLSCERSEAVNNELRTEEDRQIGSNKYSYLASLAALLFLTRHWQVDSVLSIRLVGVKSPGYPTKLSVTEVGFDH